MPYRIIKEPRFKQEVLAFLDYLHDNDVAYEKIEAASQAIDKQIERIEFHPTLYTYFHQTGSPYRAALYRYNKRNAFWLIYTMNETTQIVRLLSFWHNSLNPKMLAL